MASGVAGFAVAIAAGTFGGAASHAGPLPATTAPPTSAVGSSANGTRRATGATEQYGYGAVAVEVTVRGRRIVSLSVTSLSTLESYSQGLAQQAIPILRNEVLAAQSTQVSAVTGATYTSQAYLGSIQSALDTLGV